MANTSHSSGNAAPNIRTTFRIEFNCLRLFGLRFWEVYRLPRINRTGAHGFGGKAGGAKDAPVPTATTRARMRIANEPDGVSAAPVPMAVIVGVVMRRGVNPPAAGPLGEPVN